jgi:hypothetical protein
VLALASLYRSLGVQEPKLVTDMSTQAAHGLPVDDLTSSTRRLDCLDYEPPYIIDCARDAPGEILRHLLPDDDFRHTPSEPRRESLTEFDQTEFFDARDERVSLARTGYAYVPANCANDSQALATCRLHIAFHGCNQNKDAVGDAFYRGAGYNRWAESNAIVILYPQTVSWTPAWDRSGLAGNPRGCWDWWGYTGADYYNQLGSQMSAVRNMVERLLDR